MNEFIEECKKVLAECRESNIPVRVNGFRFSEKFEFDFDDNTETLYIRFSVANISRTASIGYDEIRSFE